MVFFGCFGKAQQAIEARNDVGIDLYLGYKLLRCTDKLVEKLLFEYLNFLVCAQDFFFVFFQFLCNVSLCLCQCLLANPFLRYLILIRIAHFEIITEDVIIANFEARDTCRLDFALLNIHQIISSTARYTPQFVEFGTESVGNNIAFAEQ